MNYRDLFPLSIANLEFMPYGEEGMTFAVRGWIPECLLIDGALAATVDIDSWGAAADTIEYATGTMIRPWYDDDEDKPDDVYHAEIIAAWRETFRGRARYTIGRFWGSEHENHPDNPYHPDGGIELQWIQGDRRYFRSDDGESPHDLPPIEHVTYFETC